MPKQIILTPSQLGRFAALIVYLTQSKDEVFCVPAIDKLLSKALSDADVSPSEIAVAITEEGYKLEVELRRGKAD